MLDFVQIYIGCKPQKKAIKEKATSWTVFEDKKFFRWPISLRGGGDVGRP